MATVKGGKVLVTMKGGALSPVVFSGTVKVGSTGVIRNVHGYKRGFSEIPYITQSNSSGNWTLTINGGTNDRFRFIALSESSTENSKIRDQVTK